MQMNLNNYLEMIEKDLIIEALRECRNNKNEASKLLGIKRTTLVMKMKRYKLIHLTFWSNEQ